MGLASYNFPTTNAILCDLQPGINAQALPARLCELVTRVILSQPSCPHLPLLRLVDGVEATATIIPKLSQYAKRQQLLP